jgi:uncharacterized protein
MKSFLASAGAVFALAYFGLLVWVYFNQRSLLYFPDRTPVAPADAGLTDMEIVHFGTADGLLLAAWYKAAPPGKATIVYFHGNAGNLLNHSWVARPLIEAGYGVLLVEYRGYGGNPGAPTEQGLIADGRAALAFLKAHGIEERDTVLFGASLGTGVAAALAAETSPKALILQSPYPSIAALGQAHYWYLPVKWLAKDRFDSAASIGKSRAPLLVVYAGNDKVVPARFSLALFELAPPPKTLERVDGAGHNNLAESGGLTHVLRFLASLN